MKRVNKENKGGNKKFNLPEVKPIRTVAQINEACATQFYIALGADLDDDESERRDFYQYAARYGLLQAISWRTSDLAKKQGRRRAAGIVWGWLQHEAPTTWSGIDATLERAETEMMLEVVRLGRTVNNGDRIDGAINDFAREGFVSYLGDFGGLAYLRHIARNALREVLAAAGREAAAGGETWV